MVVEPEHFRMAQAVVAIRSIKPQGEEYVTQDELAYHITGLMHMAHILRIDFNRAVTDAWSQYAKDFHPIKEN